MTDFFKIFYNPNSILVERKPVKIFQIILFSLILLLLITVVRFFLRNEFEVVIKSKHIDFLIINVILFGPLKEELLFRLMLIITKRNIALFLLALLISVLGFLFANYRIYLDTILLVVTLFLFSKLDKEVFELSNKLKILLVFFFSFFFWIFHIWNFESQGINEIIVTSPIFLMGIILSYVRLKTNFYFSLFLHSLFNLCIILSLEFF